MYESKSSHTVRITRTRRLRWVHICIAVVCGVSFLCLSKPVWAQRYKSLCDSALNRAQAQKLYTSVRTALRNPGGLGGAENDVKAYFVNYRFKKLTCYKNPEALGELGKARETLIKEIRGARSAEAQRLLTELSMSVAKRIAQDNFHPAVRYNATLILGNLDSKYATRTTPPVPLPAATGVLLDLLEKDSFTFKDPKPVAVHPSVKTGALVGLERHARYGVDARHVERFTKVLTSFVAEEERHEEVSRKVDHWMKCQALAALVHQFESQPTAGLQQVLLKTMDNEKFSLEDRCYVASLMEYPQYEKAEGIDGSATVLSLAKLSQDVIKNEVKLAKEFQREILADGGNFRPGGGLFRGTSQLEDTVNYEIRRLVSRLDAIRRAGKSVSSGVSEEYQTKIAELLDLMQPISDKATQKDPTPLSIAKLVVAAQPEIDRLVDSWTGGAAGEEPADIEDEFAIR